MPADAVTFIGADSLKLAGDLRGDPDAPPVVFLHGGGQTRHSWGGTAEAVADHGWCAYTIDARGHGESDWSPKGDYQLSRFAADLVEILGQIGRPAALVGASLGGMTALYAEGHLEPGRASALVLVDIVPRMEKRGTDRIGDWMRDNSGGFDTLEEAADAVAAYNPHRERPNDLAGLRKNLRQREDTRWYWHWDPSFINREEGSAPSEMMDTELLMRAAQAVEIPMMLVRGRLSDVVSDAGARAFVTELPAVEYVDVSGAGHMVAGDRNDAFTDSVVDFLDRVHSRFE